MVYLNRQFQNFCEYQFKGNYNRCCNFPNCMPNLKSHATSLNNNIIGNFKNPLVSREQLNKQGVTE